MAKVQPSITVIPEKKNLASKAYKSGVLMRLFLCWREEDAMLKDVMQLPSMHVHCTSYVVWTTGIIMPEIFIATD